MKFHPPCHKDAARSRWTVKDAARLKQMKKKNHVKIFNNNNPPSQPLGII